MEERNYEVVEVQETEQEETGKLKGFWQKNKKKIVSVGAGVGAVIGIFALARKLRTGSVESCEIPDVDFDEIVE